MDLLKDITRELRGGETTEGTSGSPTTTRTESSRRGPASETNESATSDDSTTADEPTAPDDPSTATDSPSDCDSGDGGRDDGHVCSFCETEFEADRSVCPECDAEIVLRGDR